MKIVDSDVKVCTVCALAHSNGVDIRYESDHGMDYDPETNPSPEPEPWGLWDAKIHHPAMGMQAEDHSCGKENDEYVEECDCETDERSTRVCDGCGSFLHGKRHAFVVFTF